ncbi:FAD-dependent oxidoreductase [Agromyces seonyuensis]|uniref:NAD(P)/FAD-dependent oxidoreductase n=1 Tax=Agromyces seonyuensis TaxID=2662446 RepID=A0A6I4NV84_9MICO|nr:FAD-dependent oxidoreductase [Agromyces seonyuensis]MWB98288.1 NAD(P)/FAD-dependent oxidoreductase [Agromyces seonyuensis]
MRVLVVGSGPVGARLAEELVPAVRSGSVELTLVGAEPVPAYNRVLVAEHAVGGPVFDEIVVQDPDALAEAGVRVRLGTRVVSVDAAARTALLEDGEPVEYDRIVFATGARANVPTLDGILRVARDRTSLERAGTALVGADDALPSGVTTLRDLEDAARVAAAVEGRRRIVVLGAGVLGLEFALLAARAGCEVVVVHHGPTPMPRNLDRGGGLTLAQSLRRAGVGIVAHSRAEAIAYRHDETTGEAHFDALVTADGKHVHGSLLVLSCGVGARSELATLAGLRVEQGVVVDRTLTSWSDPSVHAIGDCAHVADPPAEGDAGGRIGGGPSGLIGPGWQQADWLAARLSAEASGAPFDVPPPAERPAVVMLKGEGVDCVAVGDVAAEPWDSPEDGRRVAQWADPEHGAYVKTLTRAGVLTGFVAVGMPRTAAELTILFDRGGELPADRSLLLRFDGADHDPSSESATITPETTICWCNGVSAGRIADAAACGATCVSEVGAATRAGTGCGGCKDRIQAVLDGAMSPASVA